MSETPLVGPPSDAGDSDAPGEDGLPISSLTGTGPQNAVAPGADPDEPAPNDDATVAAPAGDPGADASDLGSASDAGSLTGSEFGPAESSDPMPDVGGTGRS
ncbi:MAG: hypothetical protein ACJ72G_14750 [Friedmanniella sp.]|jgi:hypothetical protein